MKGKVLYINSSDEMIFFRHKSFFRSDLSGKNVKKIASLNLSLLKLILSYIRIFVRLFRLEPRAFEKINNRFFIYSFQCQIFVLDIQQKRTFPISSSRKGFSNPLNYCSDEKNIYWGEYGDNKSKTNVNVYSIDQSLNIRIVYSFPSNSIRHIHNIIFDKSKDSFWILTGDQEKTSGIYLAKGDWSEVKPIKIGNQQFRAVVGFPYSGGLIYATDSVESRNHIYCLDANFNIKELCSINGSCINGVETKDYFVFSTSVEPPEGRGFFELFSYKLGQGIKSREVHLISIAKNNLNVDIIKKINKDFLPMKLFQYGMISFAKGIILNNRILLSPIACKKVDGKIINISI